MTGKLKLLHFSPEWCLIPIFKKNKNLEYITADINPAYADHQVDITDIPFLDESFDYIICSHVLGHVPDEEKAVRELYRVLKPTGTALIMTLIDWKNSETYEEPHADTPEKRLKYYSEYDLCRLHGADFDKRLVKSGFNVEKINYSSVLGNDVCHTYSLGSGNREIIFRCTK